ncbi:efflux RND transporter periplasmic adaptor subunit [bacterium]|nr:efflux RND transporter periplasmic adaptor subunit [bacterium]
MENPEPPVAPSRPRRLASLAVTVAVTVGCAAAVAVAAIGRATDWRLPKASALRGESSQEADDWCKEHGVPESACVECRLNLLPRGRAVPWCDAHGLPECPHCHPDLAQLPSPPAVTPADRDRITRALGFAPREENDARCKKHQRRIQLVSDEMASRLGIAYARAGRGAVTEVVHAPGEIGYDPTRVARVASRAAGTVWRVERAAGDRVRRGDVLALVDSAEVGRAKGEFLQAVVQFAARRETLAKLRPGAGATVAVKDVQAAEAAVEEADVRVLAAAEALANLGMPIRPETVAGLTPADLARRVQFLGLPAPLAATLVGRTASSNLLAVTAPFDGEVINAEAVRDEATDPSRPLFGLADTSRMWLTLRVRGEDADRIRPGQPVRFRHPGHAGPAGWDLGTVVWVSPAADPKTRTVPVRVDLPNPSDRHHANTFGTAEVVLRDEADAVVVPAAAVHSDGCCQIVFVRDRDYERADAPKVVHVRKVRTGARDVPAALGPVTEVAAGVLPGEWVATTNSGIFRAELLKNDLGAG